jgi:RNA polymerase sigma-54 factor
VNMLKPSLQLKLGQSLTMTPQLQQAIRLLQLPALDLEAHVREVLETNVMLEAEEEAEPTVTVEALDPSAAAPRNEGADRDGSDTVASEFETAESAIDTTPEVDIVEDEFADRTTAGSGEGVGSNSDEDDERQRDIASQRGLTLHEHLMEQVDMLGLSASDLAIATTLIDAINDDGYLTDPLAEFVQTLANQGVTTSEEEVERVLALIQYLDPVGVGARSLAECILLQLAQLLPNTPGLATAIRIAQEHLDLVGSKQYSQLKRLLIVEEEELSQALALVRGCNPRPGAALGAGAAEYVVPDVFVRRTDRGWAVELNAASLPRVRLNEGYVQLLGRGSDHAILRTQLQEARWLLKSLEIRKDTLTKVARSIVQRQSDFLEHGEEHMKPMILRDVAEAIEMHESTVSRVTSGKYMHTPRGVYELRFFFSSQVESDSGEGTSSTAIRAKIRKLIKEENPDAPLSDSRLAEILSAEGIPVARRTVAKYREALGLASSNDRRRVAVS